MIGSLIAWVLLGLVAGFIASKIVNKSGEGIVMDIVLGIVGALVGGFIMHQFGAAGPTNNVLDVYSVLVSILGAVVVLFLYHMVVGRRTI